MDETTASIVYIPHDADEPFSRHQIEAVLLVILSFARRMIDEDLTPHAICFAHPKPELTQKHEEVFRAPLRFDCPEHAIILDKIWMEKPLPESDPAMLQIHLAQAEQRLHEMDNLSTDERVKMILDSSGHFQWDRDHMARRLHMSRRTLQRNLSKAGTTFQKLYDQYRHQAALTLLKDPELSTDEVGHLLGFFGTKHVLPGIQTLGKVHARSLPKTTRQDLSLNLCGGPRKICRHGRLCRKPLEPKSNGFSILRGHPLKLVLAQSVLCGLHWFDYNPCSPGDLHRCCSTYAHVFILLFYWLV